MSAKLRFLTPGIWPLVPKIPYATSPMVHVDAGVTGLDSSVWANKSDPM